MKKTRRILSLILASVLAASVLCSCGGKDEYKEKYESLLSEIGTTSVEETTEEETTEAEESSESESDYDYDSSVPDIEFDTSGKIEKTVLYDENNIKITANELTYSSYRAVLSLLVENNGERDITVNSGSIGFSCSAINGYMVSDGHMNCELAAKKKANETVTFDYENMQLVGINGIGELKFGFYIEYGGEYKPMYQGYKELRTSQFDKYKDTKPSLETLANNNDLLKKYEVTKERFDKNIDYDQNGVNISSVLYAKKGEEQRLFIEYDNTSGNDVYMNLRDVSIDNLSVSSGGYSSVNIIKGCKGLETINMENLVGDNMKNIIDVEKAGAISFDVAQYKFDAETELAEKKRVSIKLSDNSATNLNEGNVIYNKNGIKIIPRGVVNDDFKYSDDLHLLFLIENNYSKQIRVDVKSNSLSVNGYMTDEISFGQSIPKGNTAVFDVEMQSSSLEKNKISKTSDVKNVELVLEIEDEDYKDVDSVTLNVTYS